MGTLDHYCMIWERNQKRGVYETGNCGGGAEHGRHVGRSAQPASGTADSKGGWRRVVVLRAGQEEVLEGRGLASSREL